LFNWIPTVIATSYILIDRSFIRGKYLWILFETTSSEAKEFIIEYANAWVFIFIGTYTSTLLYLLIVKKKVREPATKLSAWIPLTAMVLLVLMILSPAAKAVCALDFYKSYFLYRQELVYFLDSEKQRSVLKYKVVSELPDTTEKTFIIIIGESLSRHHMQLYGYKRKTNPFLSQKSSELIIYKDVISPHTSTLNSLRTVLTMATNKDLNSFYSKPSIVDLFNSAGFDTYWIEAQNYVLRGASYGIIARQAKHFYPLRLFRKYDHIAFPYINEALGNSEKKNKVIFIHLYGCHASYKVRYPASFNVFDHSRDHFFAEKTWLEEKDKSVIDQYDNAVLYNDYIVSSVIDKVEKQNKCSFVIYFPDHGEEVYDFRTYSGHKFNNISRYMCEIPLILWTSKKYRALVNLNKDPSVPCSTEDIIYSISDLAGLHYADYDSSKSIFSRHFRPNERTVGNVSYIALKNKSHEKIISLDAP